MKIALGIEYNGTAYCGWQKQNHSPSVQAVVEKAIAKVANHPVSVVCAGRTDTGVHALGQVVHFETDAQRSDRGWVYGANSNLPMGVSVLWAKQVKDDFHARFSALNRRYRYVILSRNIRPAILADSVTWQYKQLDVGKMHMAAQQLVGVHDFTSYRGVHCQAHNPQRNVMSLTVSSRDGYICIDIKANAFLLHMVRNIAGVLMSIGAGEMPVEWALEVLEARDRAQAGVNASPSGLYFMGVEYPPEFSIPSEIGLGVVND